MIGYVPRHYAGLLAGASQRERDRRDHELAQRACEAVDSASSLLLSVILSAHRARVVAGQTGTPTTADKAVA